MVGFGRAKETWLTLHEESYLLGTLGEFARDENGTVVLKLTMTYLEEAVRRKVNIFFKDEENIELRWFETPGKGLIMEGLESVTDELANRLLYAAMKDNRGMDVIHRLMCQTIEPVVEGRLEPGAEAVQAEDV